MSKFKIVYNSPKLIKLDEAHIDDRGFIQSIINKRNTNVSIISSVKHSIRSNHYHITDWHYMYTLKGSYYYYYKSLNDNGELNRLKVDQGQTLFTPPLECHATLFLKNTELLVISKNARDQKSYEKDTIRISLIDKKNIEEYV